MIGAAIRNFAEFQRAFGGTRDLFVAINVTKHYLREAAFLDNLAEHVASHGLTPRQIKIEITESVLIDDHEGAIAWIPAARSWASGSRSTISAPAIRASATCTACRSTS